MLRIISKTLRNINKWVDSRLRLAKEPEALEQARQEWLSAQSYYNSVSDNDLIDHAVYTLQAAEKKYTYLLKKAREKHLS